MSVLKGSTCLPYDHIICLLIPVESKVLSPLKVSSRDHTPRGEGPDRVSVVYVSDEES